MTTTQVAPDDLRVAPPPCSVENPADLNSADLPANQDNLNQFATDDQVVERQKGLAANVYPQDELRGVKEDVTPLLAHEKDASSAFPASAYHVPPEPFTPSPKPYQRGQHSERPIHAANP